MENRISRVYYLNREYKNKVKEDLDYIRIANS